MRRRILNDIIGGCAPIAAGFILAALACLLLSLCSCRTQRVVERVEVPVPIVQEHTIESVKIDHVRDTLIQRDSVYHYVKGDTVLIEKWHYLQGSSNVVRVDTLIKTDSVQVPVEVVREQIKTVEKPLSWWQKTRMGLGTAMIVLLVLALGLGGLRLYGKIKKL